MKILMLTSLLVPNLSLADTVSFNCSFPMACQAEQGCASAIFEMNFMMDTVTNDSFVVGNNGLSPVQNFVGKSGVTFLETLAMGAIQTTTMVWGGEAVHSRHTIILDDLVPSQYYGSCQRTGR